MLDFNLQRFAEEEAQESAETTDTQEAVAEEPQTEEEAKEPIPDELAGIPEDIARETMAKAQAEQSDEKKDEAEEETEDVIRKSLTHASSSRSTRPMSLRNSSSAIRHVSVTSTPLRRHSRSSRHSQPHSSLYSSPSLPRSS